VTPIMPKNTAVPRAWRISAAAPVAIASGSTPKMNANEDRAHADLRRLDRGLEAIAPLPLKLFGSVEVRCLSHSGATRPRRGRRQSVGS
jgi:hypothetical protein